MQRKDFIKTCGFACLGTTALATFLQGCTTSKISGGGIEGDELIVDLKDFEISVNEKKYKKYVVVQHAILQYPICIYRLNENEYTALWMRCTHLGSELQVFGDKLQCPAHGSAFDINGIVTNGPADVTLRTFAVRKEKDKLKISLKAV